MRLNVVFVTSGKRVVFYQKITLKLNFSPPPSLPKTGGNREPGVHGRQRSSGVHARARAQRHRLELGVRGKHQRPPEQHTDPDKNRYEFISATKGGRRGLAL